MSGDRPLGPVPDSKFRLILTAIRGVLGQADPEVKTDTTSFRDTLGLLLKARFPVLYIESFEEHRVLAEVAAVASDMSFACRAVTFPEPRDVPVDHRLPVIATSG